MDRSILKIYPLGGVAEIGSNMTVIEMVEKAIIIDCGILFPYEDFFDINYLIVDYTQLNSLKKPIELFITHGHEDHIGAVKHFLADFPESKVYAPNFARNLILKKLELDQTSHRIQSYDEKAILDFQEYFLKPVKVTHSIPDTYGLIFGDHDKNFSLLFISDFKFDLNPLYERAFDEEQAIASYFTPAKKRLAMLDSTNILNEGQTLSESELVNDIELLLSKNQRTFFTLFSSNIFRVRTILEAAKKMGRKVSTIGRSIQFYLQVAHESGLLNLDDYPIVDFEAINNYNDPKLVYIVTGSQGEFLGATRRISLGEQKNIQLTDKDLYIFSSKAIPGNEKKIFRIFNNLAEYGVTVITSKDYNVHASGHPGQQDLSSLLDLAKPTHFIPIHGETYFLRKHISFIEKNYPSIKTNFLTNFDQLLFKSDYTFKIVNSEKASPVIIHGKGIPIEREKISERRKIACNGLINVSINYKSKNIKIITHGLPLELDSYLPELKELVHFTVFQEYKNRDHDFVSEKTRIKVRNFGKNLFGYKPIASINIV